MGLRRVVINHAHLGAQIETSLGSGARFGIDIVYSPEREALETAGGIANALAFLGAEPFAAINADVYSDYDYSGFPAVAQALSKSRDLAHLILVDNPEHNPAGDFALHGGSVTLKGPRLTFSGLAVYRPELFADVAPGVSTKLAPLLSEKIGRSQVRGEHYRGMWFDIGTPQRLARLNAALADG
jgi:MurNAc alpha-1-phosphate uridylyltransferase